MDKNFAHLKAFSKYKDDELSNYDFSEEEYEDYAAMYKNIWAELKPTIEDDDPIDVVVEDYDLIAYNKLKVDFEYIVALLQGVVESIDTSEEDNAEFEEKIREVREFVKEFSQRNQKLSDLLNVIINEIEQDKTKYIGQDISVIINERRYSIVDKEIEIFAKRWFIDPSDVKYEAYNYKNGELPNENNLKEKADYDLYKNSVEKPMPKFKFRIQMIEDFKTDLMEKIYPLLEQY